MDDDILDSVADGGSPIPPLKRSRDGFTRGDVVKAFENAFHMMGGTTRLALWANANPDKFYPLYAKLLPATTINIGDTGKYEILHRIAPTALDKHDATNVPVRPTEEGESVELQENDRDKVQDVSFREHNAND
jgi:hypothetical protein